MRNQRGVSPLALCVTFFLGGVILGFVGLKVLSPDERAELVSYLEVFVRGLDAATMEPSAIFRLSFIQNLRSAFIVWILGMAVVGAPFVCVLLAIRGFAFGFSSAFLIKEVRGVFLFFSGLFPPAIIWIPTLIALCSLSVSFSAAILRERPWAYGGLWPKVGTYTLTFLLLGALLALSSAVEAYICPFFLARLSKV